MRSCENCILGKNLRCEMALYEDYMAKFDDCEWYAETWEELDKLAEKEED